MVSPITARKPGSVTDFLLDPRELLPLFPIRENGENKAFFHPLSARSILACSF